MKDVFISYSTKDQAAKDELCAFLDAHKISYWLDSIDLDLGKDISESLKKSLREAQITLMLVSDNSLRSSWVGMEAMFRLKQEEVTGETKLICVVLDDSVFGIGFPAKLQKHIREKLDELQGLRAEMKQDGGRSEFYDKEIARYEKIDVSDLMTKVRHHLGVVLSDQLRKENDLQKLLALLKPEAKEPTIISDEISGVNWEGLKTAILEEKAILFLGPEATVNFSNDKLQETFFSQLAESQKGEGKNNIRGFHERDGLLIFQTKGGKNYHQSEIRKFYNRQFENEVLNQLADIPFRLIVSASPDVSFANACKQKGYAFTQDYSGSGPIISYPQNISGQAPLIYNLLGSVDHAQSLIVTHHDLFTLMESVFKHDSLKKVMDLAFPPDLGMKPTQLVFIGFDFDKWYFQLILHILRIDPDICDQYATNQHELGDQVQTLYESHFQLNFVKADIPRFVNHLHALFQPGELRQPQPPEVNGN